MCRRQHSGIINTSRKGTSAKPPLLRTSLEFSEFLLFSASFSIALRKTLSVWKVRHSPLLKFSIFVREEQVSLPLGLGGQSLTQQGKYLCQ